jgi:predicted ATPase/transcriptional regulator with XRE-family HTH domain
MNLANEVAVQRRIRGWTQEDLAYRTGLSVRTIRNLELGVVQNPRRSSVDLLIRTLGMGRQPVQTTERAREISQWRGTRPPSSQLVDNAPGQEQLVELVRTVRANRLTTFVGPAGVGKTRLAFAVATEVGTSFRDGVAVIELGDLPAEHIMGDSQSTTIRHRVHQAIGADPGIEVLLILDNAEHVPAGTLTVVRDLLNDSPGTHVVLTARRRLTDRMGINRQIAPLSFDLQHSAEQMRTPAIDFILLHSGVDTVTAAWLLSDLSSLGELCRRLAGIPRYLEFAAERLRTVPVRYLLTFGPSLDMLSTNDHALLPHQQSAAASIGWDVDLLTAEHRLLLEWMEATPGDTFTIDDIMARTVSSPTRASSPLALISELIDRSLVRADDDNRHRYRLGPYVADFLRHSM